VVIPAYDNLKVTRPESRGTNGMDNKYYFDDAEKVAELGRILETWLGTPHRHHCGVKGLGADCIHFVGRVLEETGVGKWRKNLVPDYPRDWHLHNTRELLMERLIKEVPGEMVNLDDLKDGDIILSHYGQASSHAAIYYQDYVWQVLDNIGVVKINISDRWARRHMKYAYRIFTPLEAGLRDESR
jgi:cell wall-associated NlpC family hydrolase